MTELSVVFERDTWPEYRHVQPRESRPGTDVAMPCVGRMLNFFMAGPERVWWELTQLESGGSCRLAVHHAHGLIVEYFASGSMALRRVHELEELLTTARGAEVQ